jgi:hypothetical protein
VLVRTSASNRWTGRTASPLATSVSSFKRILCLGLIFCLIAQSALRKIFFTESLDGTLKMVDEVALLAFSAVLCGSLPTLLKSRAALRAMSSFAIYFGLGVAYAVYNRVDSAAAILQGFVELKLLIIPLAVALLCRDVTPRLIERWFLAILIVGLVLDCLRFSGGLYEDIFSSAKFDGHVALGAASLPRFSGVFVHSSVAALFGAFCLVFASFRLKSSREAKWLFCLAALVLCLTLQRNEIAGVAFTWLCSRVLRTRWTSFHELTLFAVITGLVLLSVYVAPLAAWGTTDPRVVFLQVSREISLATFPWGTGFGTFAGAGAAQYGSSLYSTHGFEFFDWYRNGMFMTDTFWPKVFVETGVFGLFALACTLAVLPRSIAVTAGGAVFPVIILMMFGLCVSATSPILGDSLFLALLGLATVAGPMRAQRGGASNVCR